ncbi:hypothetical protein ACFQ07_21195 [Actinomadura adrarensis]|uniref:LapA family protein n=1 Tax=Actinomadura adrarensis TaxID=1819600 RepID=A0ABW3CL84_9ACTN
MIVMGLVLAVVAVLFGVAVVVGNEDEAQLTAFGGTVPGVGEEWQVFMAGAIVMIACMAGITLAMFGFKRSMGMRRELRDLRDEHEESLQTLEMEKRRLEQELAQARRNAPVRS